MIIRCVWKKTNDLKKVAASYQNASKNHMKSYKNVQWIGKQWGIIIIVVKGLYHLTTRFSPQKQIANLTLWNWLSLCSCSTVNKIIHIQVTLPDKKVQSSEGDSSKGKPSSGAPLLLLATLNINAISGPWGRGCDGCVRLRRPTTKIHTYYTKSWLRSCIFKEMSINTTIWTFFKTVCNWRRYIKLIDSLQTAHESF